MKPNQLQARGNRPLHSNMSSNSSNRKLPIWEYKDKFTELFEKNQVTILVGETGCGKTTQVPQWCLESLVKKKLSVACSQPRRIAAMSVAERVAQEMKVTLGDEVGYSVRFDACMSQKTKIKYLTDGMMLREAILDPLLSKYGVIILDEAHERTLQTEILIGVVKSVLATRSTNSDLPRLKVIIMSATMNIKLFKKFFNTNSIIFVKGRQYDTTDMFAEYPQSDYTTSALICVFQIHRTTNEPGDILVFCTGQDEIESLVNLCQRALKKAPPSFPQGLIPIPFYASLPTSQQMRVFNSNDTLINTNGHSNGTSIKIIHRRVIFATNVAETSLTIPSIKFVVDTGKVKYRSYCPNTGLESLKVVSISKAQAKQRSGRSGRISSGICYRLYTEKEFEDMPEHLPPQIRCCNLDSVIFQMISIGIKDIDQFEFLERPEEERTKKAIENLISLKAIKSIKTLSVNGHSNQSKNPSASNGLAKYIREIYDLTPVGKKMSAFPVDPRMGRILVAADNLGCLDEAIITIAFLYIDSLFFIPTHKQEQANAILDKFRTNEGDLVMYLKVFRAFKKARSIDKAAINGWCNENFVNKRNLSLAIKVKKQLTSLCQSLDMKITSCGQETEKLRKALVYGLFDHVATMINGRYQTRSTKNEILIHPSSCLFKVKPECVLYVEIMETNKCYIRKLTTIDKNWISSVKSN